MRIGFIMRRVQNARYRAGFPMNALAQQGHEVHVADDDDHGRFDLRELGRCDVVHVYRRADAGARKAVEHLQQHGVAVTWDNDDDARLVPASSPSYKEEGGIRAQRAFKEQAKMVRRADVVTTTSEYLEREYRALGAPDVVRIPNFLHRTQLRDRRRRRDGVVVGWVAGVEHTADADELGISNVLQRLLDRHPQVRVETIGLRLALRSDRYTHIPLVHFDALPDRLAGFDVGIAPLSDIPMSYARSDVKLKEYAAAGLPWLASARGPYASLGPRQGGRLVGDGEWDAALDELVRSRFTRSRLSRRASGWAKTEVIDRHAGRWVDAFELATANAQGRRASEGSARRPA